MFWLKTALWAGALALSAPFALSVGSTLLGLWMLDGALAAVEFLRINASALCGGWAQGRPLYELVKAAQPYSRPALDRGLVYALAQVCHSLLQVWLWHPLDQVWLLMLLSLLAHPHVQQLLVEQLPLYKWARRLRDALLTRLCAKLLAEALRTCGTRLLNKTVLVHSRQLANELDRERVLSFASRLLRLGLVNALLLYAKHSAPRVYYTVAKYFYLYKTAQLQFQLNRLTARVRVNALLEAQDWNGFAEPKGFRALSFLLNEVMLKRSDQLREQIAYLNFALLRALALFTLSQLFRTSWLPLVLAPMLVSVQERSAMRQSLVSTLLATVLWLFGCSSLWIAGSASFGTLLLFNPISVQLSKSARKRLLNLGKFTLNQWRLAAHVLFCTLVVSQLTLPSIALLIVYSTTVNVKAALGLLLMVCAANLSNWSAYHLLSCSLTLELALLLQCYSKAASEPVAEQPKVKAWAVEPLVRENWQRETPLASVNAPSYRPSVIENYSLE